MLTKNLFKKEIGKKDPQKIDSPIEYVVREPLERRAIYHIKAFVGRAQPYVLFSGGRDSLVALDLVKRVSRLVGKQTVALYADTTVGLPDNLRYIKQTCDKLGIKLIVVRPQNDFFTLAKRKGFPRFNARWCCYELKVNPLGSFLQNQNERKIVFDGIRSEESKPRSRLAQLSWHKRFKCFVYHPILHWKKQDVLAYLERRNLQENPLYSKGFKRATECWCGVYKSVDEFLLLHRLYPRFFDRLVELESSMRAGGSYLFKRGRRIYLRDLKTFSFEEVST